MGRKPYVSIDIETTGLDPDVCQILEIGAVIDDWVRPVEKLPIFHCYVINEPIIGEPYALHMHPEIFRRIADRVKLVDSYKFLYPEEVAGTFLNWLHDNKINPRKRHITSAGKNFASFDLQFLKKLPQWSELIPGTHRCIDPGNLYWLPDADYGLPSTKTCMRRANIEGIVAHTAVEDALVVVKLVRYAAENIRRNFLG